ncbi:MAG: hypothetical protein ACQEQ0_11115 [Bacteroidota bacterium]
MEKDALLEIVLHDLKEVETLMQSFKGKAELSPAFFKLTRRKMQSILEEIDMLEELADMPSGSTSASEVKERISEIMESAKESAASESKEPNRDTENTAKPEPKPREKESNETPEKAADVAEPRKEDTPSPAPQEPAKEDPPKEEEPVPKSPEQSPAKENSPETKAHKTSSIPEREDHSSPKKESRVLGERLNTGKSSYNEQIGRKATNGASRRLINKPVSDLRKALGINDRFFFQRELFGGSAGLLNETLDQLNEMNNMEDARNFLLANFNWNPDNESVISFMNFVERRFL